MGGKVPGAEGASGQENWVAGSHRYGKETYFVIVIIIVTNNNN